MKHSAIGLLITATVAAAQTPSFSLALDTESSHAQFRLGEAIALTLTFSNSDPSSAENWMVTLTGRDRSVLGLGRDLFTVSPETGTSDPWHYRLSEGVAYSGPGGMYLREKSAAIPVDLNQWLRFEKPGHYQIHAVFHLTGPHREDKILDSNPIGIDIMAADPAWQAQQLHEDLAILNAPYDKPDSHAFEQRGTAARRLAYLDTPASVREVARLIGTADTQVSQLMQLWVRSTQHATEAIAAMKELIRDPDQPVTANFLRTLAVMDKSRTEQQLRAELATVIDNKQDPAKAISIKTLLEDMPPSNVPAKLRTEIAAVFLTLPVSQQSELLTARWDSISGPEMIPPLRQIYASASPARYPQDGRLASAVERLYELDPNETRTLLLDEIANPAPRLPYKTLAMLPDATLPAMDQPLLNRLEHNGGRPAEELISRYATPAILDGVKAWYAKHDAEMRARTSSNVPDIASPACEPPLVAYFLRVDAAVGERLLRQSLGERSYPMGRCWRVILGQTAQYNAGPVWEKVAVEALNDGVVVVKADAVRALGQFGSPASSTAVLESFRYWHDWWKDKPSEINSENLMFEQRYLEATTRAKNWRPTDGQYAKIAAYCITAGCRAQAEQYRNERRP